MDERLCSDKIRIFVSCVLPAGVREYWIVNPAKQNVVVYHLEEPGFDMDTYTFQDRIKAGIYDDLQIDFRELGL